MSLFNASAMMSAVALQAEFIVVGVRNGANQDGIQDLVMTLPKNEKIFLQMALKLIFSPKSLLLNLKNRLRIILNITF